MKKTYCVICGKSRKIQKNCSMFKNEDEEIFKEEDHWNIKNSWFNWKCIITLKIWLKKTQVKNLDLKIWMNQEFFSWRNKGKWIHEYKAKNVCTTLNYIEHFLVSSFYNYWMYFNFCFRYFDWHSNTVWENPYKFPNQRWKDFE